MVQEADARSTYLRYMEDGLKMFPPFKGFGMKFIEFAMKEPEKFNVLLKTRGSANYQDYLYETLELERVVPYVTKTFELSEADSKWLTLNMILVSIGYISLANTSHVILDPIEVGKNLGAVCRGLLLQIKAPYDERIMIMPQDEGEFKGSLELYLKGRKNVIIGYGRNKEMYQIRIDAILYFEAVGENVFAYTKENVYEIKQRLYQIEEDVSSFGFVRISKAVCVNTKKIASVAPEQGGRGKIHLNNGEIVIASRAYYKTLTESLKSVIS